MQYQLVTGAILLLAGLTNLTAAVLYVDLNSLNPTPPYADWSTAATTIQDAVDASSAGDLILVTNGVYQTGGRAAPGEVLTNRVLVTNAVSLQSVNGPEVTTIKGYQVPTVYLGDAAVRCARLADGATLSGFTLANGATRQLPGLSPYLEANGGGAWCQSTNVLVTNCIISSNRCGIYGGGVYSGTVKSCQINYNSTYLIGCVGGGGGLAYSIVSDSTIRSNSATTGSIFVSGGAACSVVSNSVFEGNVMGAANYCSLYSCTLLNNSNQYSGGGAIQCLLNNCTVSGNYAGQYGGGIYNCTLNNSVVSSNRAGYWGGGAYYDQLTNTLGRNNLVSGNTTPWQGGGIYLSGGAASKTWDLVNWTVVSNSAARDGGGLYLHPSMRGTVQLDGATVAGNSSGGNGGGFCSAAGQLALSNCTFNSNIALGSGGGAYNATLVNCLVVSNWAGTGGGVFGLATNSVFCGNVASTNGGGLYYNTVSAVGFVLGCSFTNNSALNGGGGAGAAFANCAFCANSALTNGGAAYNSALSKCLVISNRATFGAGVFADSGTVTYPPTSSVCLDSTFIGNLADKDGGGFYFTAGFRATNCLVTGNAAGNNGGGLLGGSCSWCRVDGNSAGASGGGAFSASLSLSIISSNTAVANGGGTCNGAIGNCLVVGNSAANGGGAYASSLSGSTLVGNLATLAGGGTHGSSGSSSIIYYNAAPSGPNYAGSTSLGFCCTTPLPPIGGGNVSSDPGLVSANASNFRLQTNSPCINMGSTAGATSTELDGRPRVVGGKIDIGAYEFQGAGMGEFLGWLQQHGLPTSGSVDYTDSDHDGLNNWQEWLAGTDPTNTASVLRLLTPSAATDGSGTLVTWQSVSNRTYFVQRRQNLLAPAPFSAIQSNIVGQFGTTSYLDTNVPTAGPVLYRIGVQ